MEFSYGEFCVVCKNTSFAKYFDMYIHTIISGEMKTGERDKKKITCYLKTRPKTLERQ